MNSLLPKTRRRLTKGQADHTDAWLMSYADMITLLFMFFVILVSISRSQHGDISKPTEQIEDFAGKQHSGQLELQTPFDKANQKITGTIVQNNLEKDISVDKTTNSLLMDVAVSLCFENGTADIREDAKPILAKIADALKTAPDGTIIEIAAYADDELPKSSRFVDNWELTSAQSLRILQFMVGQGVDQSKLHASSFAANQPIVPNMDINGKPIVQNKIRNQRVIIKMQTLPTANNNGQAYW